MDKNTTPHYMKLVQPFVFKRTKLIATIGPSTDSYEAIYKLIESGVNGLRLNFSHGTHEERDRQIPWIRKASKELNKPVAIYQDLQGPKIRLGEIKDNHFEVKKGDELTLAYGVEHAGKTLPVQYDLSGKVQQGERVYIFDGKIKTVATEIGEGFIKVMVGNDGVVMSRKGINLPDTDFSGDILTEKDYKDIDYGATQDIDYVGLSFVHRAHDIEILKNYLAEKGSDAQVIAKIETKTAIEDEELERIIEVSDAVMVARGDLAVEVGAEIVPVVQRKIVGLCQKHAKPSIVATQMMMSMVSSPEPTRAEVNDVSNAVITGADCVMLSDETANGQYPIEAAQTVKRVILYTQQNVQVRPIQKPMYSDVHSMAISSAAAKLADELNVDAIIAETKSGATARHLSAHRPSRPIITVTTDARIAQQLSLLYANKCFLRPDGDRVGISLAQDLVNAGYLASPSTLVMVSGRQPGVVGTTDTIRLRKVEQQN